MDLDLRREFLIEIIELIFINIWIETKVSIYRNKDSNKDRMNILGRRQGLRNPANYQSVKVSQILC